MHDTAGQKATTLSLSDALRRLIPDAVNGFAEDRGTKVDSPHGETGYALNFGIAGLTDCAIVPTDFPFATCHSLSRKRCRGGSVRLLYAQGEITWVCR
jgi:hypothetical protein